MKCWRMVVLLLMMCAVPAAMHAQVAVYAEFSGSQLAGGPQGDYIYGVTTGVLIPGPTAFHKLLISGDISGRIAGKSGERLDGVTVGPRFGLNPIFFKLAPFVGGNVGFARYNDGLGTLNSASTDALIGVIGGVTRQVSPRFDIVLDYKYDRLAYNFGFYHPQSYSGGLIYHFVKR